MVVNQEIYLKKNESLRSSQYIGSFQEPAGCISCSYKALTLPDDISQQLVREATDRLSKYVVDYDNTVRSKEINVGWLRHSQITLDQCIGVGSFSEVYTIKSIKSAGSSSSTYSGGNTNKRIHKSPDVVLKMTKQELIRKPRLLAKCAANLVKEGLILASLKHENIINVHAWTPTGIEGFHIGRTDSFFLILDRLTMTLSERLVQWEKHSKMLKFSIRNRSLKKTECLQQRLDVVLEISSGLKYLHSKRILHRDLKPDNIGFDSTGRLKIYDFDTARKLPKACLHEPNLKFELTQNAGSKRYMSKECATTNKYNLKSDVYSFGLLVHECMTLYRPFHDISSDQHDELVYQIGLRPEIPDTWPKGFKKLLENCWTDDIDERIDMHTVKKKLKKQIPYLLEAKNMKHALVSTKSSKSPVGGMGGSKKKLLVTTIVTSTSTSTTTTTSGSSSIDDTDADTTTTTTATTPPRAASSSTPTSSPSSSGSRDIASLLSDYSA